jgi:SpoVK/Ycf46/Vps4 family AAA+-type ATPase
MSAKQYDDYIASRLLLKDYLEGTLAQKRSIARQILLPHARQMAKEGQDPEKAVEQFVNECRTASELYDGLISHKDMKWWLDNFLTDAAKQNSQYSKAKLDFFGDEDSLKKIKAAFDKKSIPEAKKLILEAIKTIRPTLGDDIKEIPNAKEKLTELMCEQLVNGGY